MSVLGSTYRRCSVTGACAASTSLALGRPSIVISRPVPANMSIVYASAPLPAPTPAIARTKKIPAKNAHPRAPLAGDVGSGTGPW